MMEKHVLPSRLKGLSIAVAQVVAVSGGVVSLAQAGVAAPPSVGNPYVLGAGQTEINPIVQTDRGAGEVSVTLQAGSSVDIGGYYDAVAIDGGTVTLETGASITTENYETVGIYAGGKGGGADSIAITLNSNASVAATTGEASEDYAYVTAIEADDLEEVTITLGSGSQVSADAQAYGYAVAEAIDVWTYDQSDDGYGTSVTLDANSATITSSATGASYYAGAEGVSVSSRSQFDSATTVVDLDSSTVSVTAESGEYAYATGVDASSDTNNYGKGGAEQATTTVTLNASTVTVTATGGDYAEAYGIYADADSHGYSESSQAVVTVNLTTSNLTATASGDYAYASAVEARANGKYGATATVTLSDSSVAAVANGGGEADAEAIQVSAFGKYGSEGEASVTLNSGSVSATASATDDDYADADASAIEVDGDVASVTLNGGTVSASATAQTTVYDEAYAGATAIYAEGDQSTTVELNGTSVEAEAEATTEAYAVAIEARLDGGYSESELVVELNNGSVDATAEAGGYAYAVGVEATGSYSEGSSLTVDLDNTDITASATSTDGGDAYAVGIDVDTANSDAVITLTDSSIDVEASTAAAGILVNVDIGYGYSESGYGAAIVLNNSSIEATSNADEGYGAGVGVFAAGEGTSLTLDSSSSIEADYAAIVQGQINNAGTIRGITQAIEINNSGSIYGGVFADTIDNSGYMFGTVLADSLTVRDGGVVSGTADVGTLLVEAGGVLEAIMTDATDPGFPHFTAVDATLEDEAIVRINATSELFNPEIEGLDYLILQADTLTADQAMLNLQYSGLVAVTWADCGDDSLCVNVRAQNFEQLATNDGAANNGVSAAGAAQSVLEDTAGTDVGEEFLDLMERVVENGEWEELDAPARSEALIASNDAERVVSRYVQRLLQSGRSSGEEFSPARGLWIQALHSNGKQDRVKDSSGYEIDTTGMAFGYDTEVQPGLTVGAAFSFANAEVDVDNSPDRVETDTYMATLYGEYQKDAWFANGVLTYGQGDNDGKRHVAGEVARSDYDSELLTLRLQAGRGFATEAGWLVQPRAELSYSRVDIDSYDEKGTLLALSIDSQRYETVTLGAGVELSKNFLFNDGILTPHLDLAVYHDVASDRIQSTNSFVIGGDSFVTVGSDVEKTNISATVGASWLFSESHTIRGAYEYYGNSDFDSNSWMLRYSYDF